MKLKKTCKQFGETVKQFKSTYCSYRGCSFTSQHPVRAGCAYQYSNCRESSAVGLYGFVQSHTCSHKHIQYPVSESTGYQEQKFLKAKNRLSLQ